MGPIHGAIVNWCGHKYGYQNFDNGDESRNTLVFDFLTAGELFQNNHHKYGMSPNFAARWFEIDPTLPGDARLRCARHHRHERRADDAPARGSRRRRRRVSSPVLAVPEVSLRIAAPYRRRGRRIAMTPAIGAGFGSRGGSARTRRSTRGRLSPMVRSARSSSNGRS